MKNILYILILISATTFSQVKVSEMPAATTVDAADLIMVVQAAANKKATKAVLQESVTDTLSVQGTAIEINANDITVVDTKYTGVTGLVITGIIDGGANEDTLTGTYFGTAIKILLATAQTIPPEPPPPGFLHPITHDQTYVVHPNIVNSDVVGDVHYLCTDSIFNDHTAAYGWSIVSAAPNTGDFAVNATTGELTVIDAFGITTEAGTYVLGIEITNGTDADTALCTILYRTGAEGSVLYYVDDTHGGTDAGTFANPFTDFNDIDDYGNLTGGETVLIKRGTSMNSNVIRMTNNGITGSGERIFWGAYGTGAKPILTLSSDPERVFTLGVFDDAVDKNSAADSITIMDIRMVGQTAFSDVYAIADQKNSQGSELHRLEVYRVNNTNGAYWVRGHNNVDKYYTIRDCFAEDLKDTGGGRGFKMEANGAMDLENVWTIDVAHASINTGDQAQDWGIMKYALFQTNDTKDEGAVQIRAQGTEIEWLVTRGYHFGVSIEVNVGDPSDPEDVSITNMIALGSTVGIAWQNFDSGSSHIFDSFTFENIFVPDAIANGINLFTSGSSGISASSNPLNFDNITLTNCLVPGAATYGAQVTSTYHSTLTVQNSIFTGSGTTDVFTTGTISLGTLQNNIYDDITSLLHWGTVFSNYSTTLGIPFVGGTDYTTDSDFTDVINSGRDISQVKDIIGNLIDVQDIGPFEFGGPIFNWTDR